jgi:hypothetical protein
MTGFGDGAGLGDGCDLVNRLRPAIKLCLPLVHLAKADDTHAARQREIAKQVQPLVQIPNRNAPLLAVSGIVCN